MPRWHLAIAEVFLIALVLTVPACVHVPEQGAVLWGSSQLATVQAEAPLVVRELQVERGVGPRVRIRMIFSGELSTAAIPVPSARWISVSLRRIPGAKGKATRRVIVTIENTAWGFSVPHDEVKLNHHYVCALRLGHDLETTTVSLVVDATRSMCALFDIDETDQRMDVVLCPEY